jgi:Phosphate transport regulator (distant homolog of PhoU)
MLNLFRALMPREERFFDLFAEHARKVASGADALRAMMQGSADDLEERFRTIRQVESEADAIEKELQLAVHRTFIVPFDRSDIQELGKRMDDILDLIEETARHLVEAGFTDFTREMLLQADAIVRCANLLAEGMPMLRDIPRHVEALHAMTGTISQIESEGDRLLREAKFRLREESGGLDAPITHRHALQREIVELLESVLDACEDVADTIDGIIVEQV